MCGSSNLVNNIKIIYKDINKFSPGDITPRDVLLDFKVKDSGVCNAVFETRKRAGYFNDRHVIDDIIFDATGNYTTDSAISNYSTNSLFTINEVDFVDSDTTPDNIDAVDFYIGDLASWGVKIDSFIQSFDILPLTCSAPQGTPVITNYKSNNSDLTLTKGSEDITFLVNNPDFSNKINKLPLK